MVKSGCVGIIVAGGSGYRMGTDENKLFLVIGKKMILQIVLENIFQFTPLHSVILVYRKQDKRKVEKILDNIGTSIRVILVEGGLERANSVRNALLYMQEYFFKCSAVPSSLHYTADYFFIHDAARPFVNKCFLDRLWNEVLKNGTAIPALPIKDTVMYFKKGFIKTMDRSNLYITQTPQFFSKNLLKYFLSKVDINRHITDEVSFLENTGVPISFVPGVEKNFKLTTWQDYLFSKFICESNDTKH